MKNARMLIEGGYLHSMRRLIEAASATPDLPPQPTSAEADAPTTKRPGTVKKTLRRLSVILLGHELEN